MKKKYGIAIATGVILLVIGALILADDQDDVPVSIQDIAPTSGQIAEQVTIEADDSSDNPTDVSRTLDSLQRVDDYPLYVMTVYGDYGFREMLEDEGVSISRAVRHGIWACTTFAALNPNGNALLGRNFDWHNRPSLLLFTDPPDGYASASMVDISYLGFGSGEPSEAQLENLLEAPYWPFDGMNEAGLAVGMMAVPHAEGGDDPEKATLDSLLVIRLLLDYAGNVDEAIALLEEINVDFGGGPPLHYLIADSSGQSVVIEFIDDEMVLLRNEDPWQVSTNFVISEVPEDERIATSHRYQFVTEALVRTKGLISEAEAMALLREVANNGSSNPTMWSTVYNMSTGGIQVVVGRQYDTAHEFRLNTLAE
jgi:hypothetical protein